MVAGFQLCHQEGALLFFVYGQPVCCFGYRYRPERQVEVVFQFGFAGALTMGESCKLLGILEDALDLEPQGIPLQYPGVVFLGVGRERVKV